MNNKERLAYFAAHATEEDIGALIPATAGECAALFHQLGFGPQPQSQDSCRYMTRHNVTERLRYWAKWRHAELMLASAPPLPEK